jgi:putative mRNA 3-end processing factor
MLLTHKGRSSLFDYGMLPSTPPKVPEPAPKIEIMLLSHAHLDHSGMVPWVADRYGMPIWATEPTAVVSDILASDSQKIADMEGYDPPFNKHAPETAWDLYDPMIFGESRGWNGMEIEAVDAGHIPGATMFKVAGEREMLFTGDISATDSLLVGSADPVHTDVLVLESTYGGRDHPDRRELIGEFIDKIEEIVGRGGTAIVPVFAVGRTQEILMMLYHLDLEIWVDGMGRSVAERYMETPRFLREPKELRRAMRSVRQIARPSDRKKALHGDVIVTTSGMLDGGPVLEYANRLNSKENAILLTGYQVEGTNGRLLKEEKALNIAGAKVPIETEVVSYDFSAHAGHSELIEFAEKCDPELIVLMHGDNRQSLADDLQDYQVLMPVEGETYEL